MSIVTLHQSRAELLPSGTDNFFRYHDGEVTEVKSDGDVESPYGHFTLREVTAEHIATWTEHAGFGKNRLTPGWYIDVRGSDGTIWAFDYLGSGTHSEENARAAFEAHAEAYRDWYIDAHEDEYEHTDETEHVNYPHEPGYLIDCPACEGKCHCTEGSSECVWSGHHG